MIAPNRDQAARDALDDLGLINDDHTETLTATPTNPGVAPPGERTTRTVQRG